MSESDKEGSIESTHEEGTNPAIDQDALRVFLRDALRARYLVRGIKEVIKSLIRGEAFLCVVVESCNIPQYVKIIELLCRDKSVPLIKFNDPQVLAELAGLHPTNSVGETSSKAQCNSLIVKKGTIQDSTEKSTVIDYIRSISAAAS